MKKERDWYKQKGKMMLFKNDKLIREYRYNDIYKRRSILRIWNIEVKFSGKDRYELIIKPD
jgi:hypothetical protein